MNIPLESNEYFVFIIWSKAASVVISTMGPWMVVVMLSRPRSNAVPVGEKKRGFLASEIALDPNPEVKTDETWDLISRHGSKGGNSWADIGIKAREVVGLIRNNFEKNADW